MEGDFDDAAPDDSNEMAAHGLPVVNNGEEDDDDDNDEMGGHDPPMADVPPPVDLVQPPDNPPGEITGVEVADQAEEHGAPMGPEIPGVEEEESEPEIPGVEEGEEDKVDDDVDNQSTQDEATAKPPPAPPKVENNLGSRYNLHGGQNRNYNHHYIGEDFVIDNEDGIVMTTRGCSEVLETPQMSLKAGLQTFGNDGMKAVEKEMHQLHDCDVMTPVHKHCLMPEQRKEVLGYLMFLKRKCCGKIKGCRCADGHKQRAYITKEESTAPMVSTEAVFLTAVIDALAVLDVPGAFMQAEIDSLVHVWFTGAMVSMLLQIDHEMYKDYVMIERGEWVMYMKLLKALYGTFCTARLFWQKLSKQLIDVWGFVPNKYDDCVVNKMINGHQMTVVWHVNDLKVSHMDAGEVEKFIQQMEETFGKDTPLTVSRGQVHDYLGMTLDFCNKGEVRINMEHYIDMMLQDAPKEMEGFSNTPAAPHLFKTNLKDPQLLGTEQKKIFVHLVMQGLYLSQRGRPDICTTIAFLSGWLYNPDEDDYKKLTRMIQYLCGTKDLILTLQAKDDRIVWWWIDASYAVHEDMKGHTGAMLSLGKGAIYSGSWKQRLVARSSTESELIGVYDALPQVLWTKQFLEEQGWLDSTTMVYQDNTSSILREKNGRSSSMKRTKHMNIRYFYVTEQVQKKAIHVTHCPTEELVGDFFTKPLQGLLFIKIRDYIIGNEEPAYQALPRSVLSNHNPANIRKQKCIGTRNHNSEAMEGTKHEHRIKDLDGSRSDDFSENIHGTTLQATGGDDKSAEQSDAKEGQCGDRNRVVEPQSYQDVLVNG